MSGTLCDVNSTKVYTKGMSVPEIIVSRGRLPLLTLLRSILYRTFLGKEFVMKLRIRRISFFVLNYYMVNVSRKGTNFGLK